MINFEKFETVYWIAGEDRKFEVLEAKIVDILQNDEVIIEYDHVIYLYVPGARCFKHNDYGREMALDCAKYLLETKIEDYHAKIKALERAISEITGDDEDSQYKKLKRVAIKDRLEGQLKALCDASNNKLQ